MPELICVQEMLHPENEMLCSASCPSSTSKKEEREEAGNAVMVLHMFPLCEAR